MYKNIIVLSLILCFVSGIVIASPIRSNIAGDNIVIVEEETQDWNNPYVSNGLICMYDGEWNVEPFVHDGDSSVWKDLVGDKDLEVDKGKSVWGNYYIEASGVNAVDDHFAQCFGSSFKADSVWAIEIVVYFDGQSLNTSFLFDVGVNTRGIANRYNNLYTSYTSTATILDMNVYNKAWRSLSAVYSDEGLDHSITYKNGQPTNFGKITLSGGAATTGYIALSRMRSKTRIACIRVYNRKLTQEEVEVNYSIDKGRFNLP